MVLGQLPPRKIAPPPINPTTNLNPTPNPNLRSIFLRGNCLVAPATLKLTLTLTENPTLNGGQFFSGGNCPYTQLNNMSLLIPIKTIFERDSTHSQKASLAAYVIC